MVDGKPVVWVTLKNQCLPDGPDKGRRPSGALQEHGTSCGRNRRFFLVMASITTLFSIWFIQRGSIRLGFVLLSSIAGIGKRK